ncbi:MAG: alpha amylase C-terminal domain-containing protein, partial [Bacteroidales bacterium]|nr:alpha amylase C-terminal domain-containing protein [Bacteroidales bacterium]
TQSFEGYGIAMPAGEYKIVLTNDAPVYGGLNRVDQTLTYFSLPVEEGLYAEHYLKMYIPNHTVLVFKKVK